MNKQIEALKLALDALDCIYSPLHIREINKVGAAMSAIREALVEQPAQQEPVAALQRVMARLADLLDEDQFAEIERIVTNAGVTPPASKPLTDEQINLFINGRGEEGDDDYVEPTGDGFGLTDADLVQLVRRVEAAHGITGETQ